MEEQPLFFIDTNPDDEENSDKEVSAGHKVDLHVLGKEDAVTAEKRRKKKETERNLSKFLFGAAVSSDEGVDVSKPESESSDDEDDDNDDDDSEDLDSDNDLAVIDDNDDAVQQQSEGENDDDIDRDNADEVDDSVDDDSDASDADSDDDRNVQDLLPEDTFKNNLNARRGKKRKAAWKDEADDDVLVKDVAANYKKAAGNHGTKDTSTEKYGKSVQRKFRTLVGEPSWAKLDRDEDADSDEEFFRETTDLLDKSKGQNLDKEFLEHRKLKDLNNETHKEGTVIRSTEFHPTSTVGLVAGLSGTATIFQVDGKNNPKIQTVNFKDFPVKTAKFSTDGNEVIVGSQYHPYFHVYDMMAGKISKIPWAKKVEEFTSQKFEVSPDGKIIAFKGRFGSIHLVSARTKEYMRSLKMNDECQAIKFSGSGSQLYSHGEGGEVYVWDIRSSICVNKFVDDGCIAGSALAVNSSYLATGSSEGVVNIYNINKLSTNNINPTPDKVILNLTTQINQLTFNPTGEILAVSSELKDSAVKLVHFPSMSVFSNFPNVTQNIHRANCVGFSPGSGYMAIGNNRGAANLYRLKHYKDY